MPMKLQQVLEPPGNRADSPAAMIPESEAQAESNVLTARAVANIAEWSTYLPPDCVEAMIRDGWHLTA